MNSDILLDSLISQSNGDTLYFDERTCPQNLLKETILRGFQVHCESFEDLQSEGRGKGEGSGYPDRYRSSGCGVSSGFDSLCFSLYHGGFSSGGGHDLGMGFGYGIARGFDGFYDKYSCNWDFRCVHIMKEAIETFYVPLLNTYYLR